MIAALLQIIDIRLMRVGIDIEVSISQSQTCCKPSSVMSPRDGPAKALQPSDIGSNARESSFKNQCQPEAIPSGNDRLLRRTWWPQVKSLE